MKEKETQSALIQFKVKPSVKEKLQKMSDKDNRKLADFVRINIEKLIK